MKKQKDKSENYNFGLIWKIPFWLVIIIIAIFVIVVVNGINTRVEYIYDNGENNSKVSDSITLKMDDNNWSYEHVCKKFSEQNNMSYDTVNDRYINAYSEEMLYYVLSGFWPPSIQSEGYKNLDQATQYYFRKLFENYFNNKNKGKLNSFTECFLQGYFGSSNFIIDFLKKDNKNDIQERWKLYSEYYIIANKELSDIIPSNSEFIIYRILLDFNKIDNTIIPEADTSFNYYSITEIGLNITK